MTASTATAVTTTVKPATRCAAVRVSIFCPGCSCATDFVTSSDMVCSPSQGKLSKVEWLGLESRLKMTAGGWYHTVCSGSLATPRVVLSGLLRTVVGQFGFFRSEERRVGKECGCSCGTCRQRKNGV